MHLHFHPPLVHFPIAFYFLELVLLLFWWKKGDAAYRRFALFSFRMGYLLMMAAVIAGFIDSGAHFPLPKGIRPHALAAVSVFILYTLRLGYWQWAREEQKFYRKILIGGAVLGTLLVALTGFLGGELVYG